MGNKDQYGLAGLIAGTRYDPDWPSEPHARSGMIPEIEGDWLDRDEVLAALLIAAEAEAATLRAEVERLRGRLQDMIAVAEQDGWDKAMTGRQLVIADARAALEGKA